jgi:hypothetical protein
MGCRSRAPLCGALCAALLWIGGCDAFDDPTEDGPVVPPRSPPSGATGTAATPPRTGTAGTAAMPAPMLEPPLPIGPPPPPPSCGDGEELIGDGVAFQQPFTRCFTWAELADSSDVPHLAEPDDDAGIVDADACPRASALDWGSASGTCMQRPFCDAPIEGLVPADEDAGTAPPPRCCYWVTQVCGL